MSNTLDGLKVLRNWETGKLMLSSCIVDTGAMYVPYGYNSTDKSCFVNLCAGPEPNKGLKFLAELDQFVEGKVQAANLKYGTNLEYQSVLQKPMSKDQDDNLVVNEEALEKHGLSTTVRFALKGDQVLTTVQVGGKKVRPDLLEFEGLVHPGARVQCICSASLWTKEDSTIQLALRCIRFRVVETKYDQVEFMESGELTEQIEFEEI